MNLRNSYHWGRWKEYAPSAGTTPYLDWSLTGSGDDVVFKRDTISSLEDLIVKSEAYENKKSRPSNASESNWIFAGLNKTLPMPFFATNPNFPSDSNGRTIPKLPEKKIGASRKEDGSPVLGDQTVIAGVIDIGMPLGHDRWRFPDGTTRILSAWQMMAPWALKRDPNLPFGVELHEDDINQLLVEYCDTGDVEHLDEQGFNQATGVTDFYFSRSQRDAAEGTSHGAHVLDVVAGADRYSADEDAFRNNVRIIAVNAPSSATFGASGTYFEPYMFHAIQRITDLADKIWTDSRTPEERAAYIEKFGYSGFPIVINISFGKQAGSKDTLDEFPAEIRAFLDYRNNQNLSKVYFVMPVGNDNIERCNAFLEPVAGGESHLQWRVLPQDLTSNFAEVWVDAGSQRWSRKFGPVVKVDRIMKETIQNEETQEPFA